MTELPSTHGIGTYFGSGEVIPNLTETPAWFQARVAQQSSDGRGCQDELGRAQQCIRKHRLQEVECYIALEAYQKCREQSFKKTYPEVQPAEGSG